MDVAREIEDGMGLGEPLYPATGKPETLGETTGAVDVETNPWLCFLDRQRHGGSPSLWGVASSRRALAVPSNAALQPTIWISVALISRGLLRTSGSEMPPLCNPLIMEVISGIDEHSECTSRRCWCSSCWRSASVCCS